MALLPTTGLESHPVGTTGLNGVINGNWEVLEAMFLALSGGTPSGRVEWNGATKKFQFRAGSGVIPSSATPNINFSGSVQQTLALTHNATFATSNLLAGREAKVIVSAAALQTLAFPGGWTFVGGAAPTDIAAGKTGILSLESTTAADAGVIARWTVQP